MASAAARLGAHLRRARALGLSYRAAAIIMALNLAAIAFEGFGIGMLLPIFEYIEANGDLAKLSAGGRHWSYLLGFADWLGVSIGLALLLGASLGAIVLRQFFTFLRLRYNSRVLFRAMHELRVRAFADSMRTRTAAQQETALGEAVNDVAVELPKAVNALYGTIHFASRLLLIAVYLGGLFLIAAWMTVISLGVLAATGLLLIRLLRQSAATSAAITDANRRFAAFLVERLHSLRLIRLSGTEQAERENLERLSARQRDREVDLRIIAAKLDAAIEPIAVLIGFVVLYVGYSQFGMPIGVLGMFLVVMMRLLPATKEAISAYQSIVGQWASLRRIDERMREMAAAREPKGGSLALVAVAQGIRFESVSYAYSPDVPALVDVSCFIPARRITALVGPSGSGKSTFIDLLPRLRDPDTGAITIDGTRLDAFAVKSLRAGIAYVPQQPQLFDVPAAQHIRYGRPDASDDDVRVAARLAGAAEFVERLPRGYDTPIGEGGGRLSGGQRQRLDLARALVRRAPILILDEPTSQLDADSEEAFRQALRRIRAETEATIVVVAHRLSTVAEADRILVLEQGALTDSGTHHELVRRGGWYAKAFAKQSGEPPAPRLAVAGGS
jgi:subfamily B ATP-binding cassette protein MsbA